VALIALLRGRPDGASWPELAFEVADAGSAVAVWDRRYAPDLFAASEPSPLDRARAELRSWSDADFRFLTFVDADYPRQLADVYQFPPILFAKGELRSWDVGVSVVGSRSASDRGLAQAREIAALLVDAEITVVSGLAAGIDTAAHTTALATGGRTVAVIGTGIRRHYPAGNRDLQDEIAARGLVISQFWPDAPPSRTSFPLRNATMSAYGKATIIVEAGETSGARIQARVAVNHGRPVVLMDSVAHGTNWGAKLRGQPGVKIATSPQQAIEHVQKIMERARMVSELLAATDRT
jgi:DNA processing protein